MTSVSLKCHCGEIAGVLKNASATSGIHLICYCDSCQDFQKQLGCDDKFLNEHGGTEIYQTAPSQIEIIKGREHIRSLKLSKKGPFRWYAGCCNTPIGNTMKASMPFVGVIHSFIDEGEASRLEILGPIQCEAQTQHAYDSLPVDIKRVGFPLGITLKIISKILFWKLKGLAQPSPFFDVEGNPISEPKRVS